MTNAPKINPTTKVIELADRLKGFTNAEVSVHLCSLPINSYQTDNNHSGMPWDPFELHFSDGSCLQLFNWDNEDDLPALTPGFGRMPVT